MNILVTNLFYSVLQLLIVCTMEVTGVGHLDSDLVMTIPGYGIDMCLGDFIIVSEDDPCIEHEEIHRTQYHQIGASHYLLSIAVPSASYSLISGLVFLVDPNPIYGVYLAQYHSMPWEMPLLFPLIVE